MTDGDRTRSIIERWIGAAAGAVLALACLLILRPFISAALWAAILCFTTWPLFIRLKAELGGRPTIAASLATVALSAIIIAPVAILVSRLSGNVAEIIGATRKFIHEGPAAPPAWVTSLPLVGSRLAAYWNLLSESSANRFSEIVKWLPTMQKAKIRRDDPDWLAAERFRQGQAQADRQRNSLGQVERLTGYNGITDYAAGNLLVGIEAITGSC